MRFLSAFVLASALSATAFAQTYNLDRSHSSVRFNVDHMMFSEVEGNFTDFSGTYSAPNGDITKGKFTTVIKATSINTGDVNRDGHLRGEDFFEVATYPEIRFESTSIRKTGEGKFDVTGVMTMHGVSKPVVLAATMKGPIKDGRGGTKVAWRGTTTINRKDFGLKWNKATEAGGVAVSEEVRITINAEFDAAK